MKKIILLLPILASCNFSNQSNQCNLEEKFIIVNSEKHNNIIEEYQIYSLDKNWKPSFRFIWNDSVNKFKIGDTLILIKK